MIDISMPEFLEKQIENGIDLAIIIRKRKPNTKIIMISGYYDIDQVSYVLKQVDPEGFIAKGDLDPMDFITIIKKIINGERYRSQKIKEAIEKIKVFGATNLKIIVMLSKGADSKKIEDTLGILRSALQKRKTQIKEMLNIAGGNDQDLLAEAEKRKIIRFN
jgi:DNA-binding NarL/FixJ family response regulator